MLPYGVSLRLPGGVSLWGRWGARLHADPGSVIAHPECAAHEGWMTVRAAPVVAIRSSRDVACV